MAHRLKIQTQRVNISYDEAEEILLDEPLFVQLSSWTIVGIYPKAYDYGDGKKGLTYNCYTISTQSSGRATFKFDEIPDWTLVKLDKDKLEGDRGNLIDLIRNKLFYVGEMTEANFLDWLTSNISNVIPIDRVKVQFQKRTH